MIKLVLEKFLAIRCNFRNYICNLYAIFNIMQMQTQNSFNIWSDKFNVPVV